jgi:carboxymethylenebutenolidase
MPMTTQTITFASGNHQLAGFLVLPEGVGPHPALVVIHEAYGLNDNIRGLAQRYAAEGYAALAVDLFAGRNQVVCMFRFFGGMLWNSTDHGGIHDLRAALDWLAAHPAVNAQQLGAVGYCLGGSLAVAWSCVDQRLKAIAPYYGMNPRPLEAVRRACPVVGSFPSADFTADGGRKLDAALTEYRIPHDIKIYDGAKHSFMSDQTANYHPAAAADSWQRTLDFFREHIRRET